MYIGCGQALMGYILRGLGLGETAGLGRRYGSHDVRGHSDDCVGQRHVQGEFEDVEQVNVGLGNGGVRRLGGGAERQTQQHSERRARRSEVLAVGGGEEARRQAEAETESGAAVAHHRIEGRRVDMDRLGLGAPLVGVADGPARIHAGKQQRRVRGQRRRRDGTGNHHPLGAGQVEPFAGGQVVDAARHPNSCCQMPSGSLEVAGGA